MQYIYIGGDCSSLNTLPFPCSFLNQNTHTEIQQPTHLDTERMNVYLRNVGNIAQYHPVQEPKKIINMNN
jgi:hypothetical protein